MAHTDKLQERVQKEINDLSRVISGLIESFRQVRSPLEESREKVPQATSQLDRVTEQTEAATHRMLDRLELMTDREEDVMKGLERIRQLAENGQLGGIAETAQQMNEKAAENLNDAFQVMDSLQFQDITAQQINHAAALLEDVDRKLKQIIRSLDGSVESGEADDDLNDSKRIYDSTAEYTDRQAQQQDIDTLFDEAKRK